MGVGKFFDKFELNVCFGVVVIVVWRVLSVFFWFVERIVIFFVVKRVFWKKNVFIIKFFIYE